MSAIRAVATIAGDSCTNSMISASLTGRTTMCRAAAKNGLNTQPAKKKNTR